MFWILVFYNIFVCLCESANLAGVTHLLKSKYKDANTQWLSKNLQKMSEENQPLPQTIIELPLNSSANSLKTTA